MPQESPLSGTEEGVGFHIGSARSWADTSQFVFDKQFANERSAKTTEGKFGNS